MNRFSFNGIQYVSWQHDEYLSAAAASAVNALVETGANWAGVLTTWYQADARASKMAPDPLRTPSDAAITRAVGQLKTRGLKVMLKPHIDAHNGDWRGTFQPDDRDAWFENYRVFLQHHARLAESLGVEMLCVGTELVRLSHSNEWRKLIADSRLEYTGTLTYAANATHKLDEFSRVSFWDQLDLIGLDAYFPVSHGWRGHIPAIRAIAQRFQKPVIFTEIGYRSVARAAAEPWNYTSPGKYNAVRQAACYRLFFEQWSAHADWMQGAFWWNWPAFSPDPGNISYTPRSKAAEAVLADWFSDHRAARIEEIRRQIEAGEYRIDALELSKAILRHQLDTPEPKD